jgi:tetratricopeptide (TPR) repeat protein
MVLRLIFIITSAIIWHLCISYTLAVDKKYEDLDKFPPNPLEMNIPDPLLVNLDLKNLTGEERQKLNVALDELNQEALIILQNGDQERAFEIWNRELRLRRVLGILPEMEALGRVGEIARNENKREQVQYITQRLQSIQKQVLKEKSSDLELWRSLGNAYQKIRNPQLALTAYDQVLINVQKQQDVVAEIEILETIGELHLSWFDYTQGSKVYEKMLNLAINRGDKTSRLRYLQQLAYIYDQGKQPLGMIEILNKLIDVYRSEGNLTQIPGLKLAIASNYEKLAKEDPNLLQEAFSNYQQAYKTAWELEQYTRAGEALQKLISLYRSQKQIDAALETSKILIETQTLANNFYGLMMAYQQIGNLYLEQEKYSQAMTAFGQGLVIAKQLKLPNQESYFQDKITKLKSS